MVLPVFQLARGQLQQQPLDGVAELPHQRHMIVLIQGQDTHSAGMLHHLPVCQIAVGQLRLVLGHLDDLSLKNRVTVNFALSQVHIPSSLQDFWLSYS